MNTRTAEIDPATLRFHVLDQAIMAAQITRVMGLEFGDYVTERFARMLPLHAESVRAFIAPDQQYRLDKPLADPQTSPCTTAGWTSCSCARAGHAGGGVEHGPRGDPRVAAELGRGAGRTRRTGQRRRPSPQQLIASRKFEREFEAFSAQREFLRRLLHHRSQEQLQERRRHRAVPDEYQDMVYGTDAALEAEDPWQVSSCATPTAGWCPRDMFLGHERAMTPENEGRHRYAGAVRERPAADPPLRVRRAGATATALRRRGRRGT